jgi:hypothetical protein
MTPKQGEPFAPWEVPMPERLLAAVERVLSAEEVVERQRNRVEELNAAGKPAATSEALLDIYISTLAIFEDYALILREELEPRKGRHFEFAQRKAASPGAPAIRYTDEVGERRSDAHV